MSLSTVTATIQDPSGQIFANGTWQLIFKPTYGTPGLFTDGGVPFNTLFGGSLDATGSFSQAINRNDTISPAGSHWTLLVTPNASGQAYSVDLNVNSGAFNASSFINAAITNIQVSATPIALAYKDSEIVPTPRDGNIYFDTTLNALKIRDAITATWLPFTPSFYQVVNVLSDVGIQAAINAAPDGGMVYLPVGIYVINGTITISKRITIKGMGWGPTGTLLQVAANVGATTDVFLIKPSAAFIGVDMSGVILENFHIQAASGTPGRSAIMIDGTNASVSNLVIDHVRCDPLGNYSFNIQNAAGLVNGTPYLATISNCVFDGGMNFTNAGDSIMVGPNNQIRGTSITSPNSPNNILIALTGAAGINQGAHGFQLVGNNMIQQGGTVVQNCTQGVIAYNDIEMPIVTTEVNSALIDVQGNASANIQNLKIYGNYGGATSGNVNDNIRIDRATGTECSENFNPRSTGVVYRVTANAVDTHIAFDRIVPITTINNWLSDAGTNTMLEYVDSAGTGAKTFAMNTSQFIQIANNAGVVGGIIGPNFFAQNPTSGVFGFTSGIPGATGLDTVAWRGGANQWVFGNAFGNTSGLLLFGSQAMVEDGAPAAVAGRAVIWADSTSHRVRTNLNNIGVWTIPGTIDSGTAEFTGQSASIATQTPLTGTVLTGGHYQFNLSALCTATDASGATVTFSVTWTSDGVSQTVTTGALPLTTTTNSNVRLTTFMNVDASTNVTWVATVTGVPTTGRFAVHAGLLKL